MPTPRQTTGRRSVGSALVIPAERNAREPESIDTEQEDGTRTERRGAPCGYGSRLPRPPLPLTPPDRATRSALWLWLPARARSARLAGTTSRPPPFFHQPLRPILPLPSRKGRL